MAIQLTIANFSRAFLRHIHHDAEIDMEFIFAL